MPRLLHHISARYLSVANLMLIYSTFVYYLLTLCRLRVLNSLILLLLI